MGVLELNLRTIGLWLTAAMLLALASACCARPTESVDPGLEQDAPSTLELETVEVGPEDISPDDLEPRKQSDCPDLDSQLLQIARSPEPLSLAKQMQIEVKGNKVQVLLLLNSEDVGFLKDFEVEIDTQSGARVQAFVPIDQLCDLANTDEVLAIRPLARPSSQ